MLKEIEKLKDIRVRISSIEPNLITSEIINIVSASKVLVPHFHIPLQSGSDKILKLMKRRYLSSHYKKVIQETQMLNYLIVLRSIFLVYY